MNVSFIFAPAEVQEVCSPRRTMAARSPQRLCGTQPIVSGCNIFVSKPAPESAYPMLRRHLTQRGPLPRLASSSRGFFLGHRVSQSANVSSAYSRAQLSLMRSSQKCNA